MTLNQFILDGRLARAPELRYTASGLPVCAFTVACNTVHGSGEQRREVTAFIPVTTVGKLAQATQRHLRQGAGVTVMGRLGSWYDAQAGKGGFTFQADRVVFRERAPRPLDAPAAGQPPAGLEPVAPVAESRSPDAQWVHDYEAASAPLARAQ